MESSALSHVTIKSESLTKLSNVNKILLNNTTTNKKSFNISAIKESLLNPKAVQTGVVDDISKEKDFVKENGMRKRSNTWPIKKAELNTSTSNFEETFAENLHKELGIECGKQLKNPWGNLSYSQLIEKAIESSPWKSLSLKEIYAWFTKYVPYFKDKSNYKSTMGWKVCLK